MHTKRFLCALAGALFVGSLAASAGASFILPKPGHEGLTVREWRLPSRYLYDPVVCSITPNTCPRIRLGDLRMAAHQIAMARGG